MIEVSEYRYDPDTETEHFDNPGYLKEGDYSITFNTLRITGIDETITVLHTGRVIRGDGQELILDDPARPRMLRPVENRVRMREIFLTGPEQGIVCIRRLSES
jgi:hypothetical protein